MHREFGIEIDIDAAGAIVELEITEQRHIGPHITDVEQFAPAMMTDDDVRIETELLEIRSGAGDDVGTPHRGIEFARCDMRIRRRSVRLWIGYRSHARYLVRVRLAEEHHVVLPRCDQMPDDMQVLSREILVNEQIFHAATLQGEAAVADRRMSAGPPAAADRPDWRGLGGC